MKQCQYREGMLRKVVDRNAADDVQRPYGSIRVECMLDAYRTLKLIDEKEREAGTLYRKACLDECEQILKKANAVLTPAQKKVIRRVCCEDKRVGDNGGIDTLRNGLEKLTKVFKIR